MERPSSTSRSGDPARSMYRHSTSPRVQGVGKRGGAAEPTTAGVRSIHVPRSHPRDADTEATSARGRGGERGGERYESSRPAGVRTVCAGPAWWLAPPLTLWVVRGQDVRIVRRCVRQPRASQVELHVAGGGAHTRSLPQLLVQAHACGHGREKVLAAPVSRASEGCALRRWLCVTRHEPLGQGRAEERDPPRNVRGRGGGSDGGGGDGRGAATPPPRRPLERGYETANREGRLLALGETPRSVCTRWGEGGWGSV